MSSVFLLLASASGKYNLHSSLIYQEHAHDLLKWSNPHLISHSPFLAVARILLGSFHNTTAQEIFEPVFDSSAAAASAMNEELAEVAAECYPERPRPVRNGERNRFNLERLNSVCVDDNRITYEWGQFNKIDGADACAEECINSVNNKLYTSTRGFEYDCKAQFCRW